MASRTFWSCWWVLYMRSNPSSREKRNWEFEQDYKSSWARGPVEAHHFSADAAHLLVTSFPFGLITTQLHCFRARVHCFGCLFIVFSEALPLRHGDWHKIPSYTEMRLHMLSHTCCKRSKTASLQIYVEWTEKAICLSRINDTLKLV